MCKKKSMEESKWKKLQQWMRKESLSIKMFERKLQIN